MNQINHPHTMLSYFSKVHFSITLPPTPGFSWWSVFFWLSQQSSPNLPMHTTYLYRLVLIYLIILIVFGEECKLWSSSLCCYLHPANISSLIVCVALCAAFCLSVVCYFVWYEYVYCYVLCLIVLPLPPGKIPYAVQLTTTTTTTTTTNNNNNNHHHHHHNLRAKCSP
jgi:hypothetical protein